MRIDLEDGSVLEIDMHTATHCNTLQHTHTIDHIDPCLQDSYLYCGSPSIHIPRQYCDTLQHTFKHCNTLPNTASHCNSLQLTAAHCSTLQHTHMIRSYRPMFATQPFVLWVAVNPYALNNTATHCNTLPNAHCNTLQQIAAHCNSLHHTTQCVTSRHVWTTSQTIRTCR